MEDFLILHIPHSSTYVPDDSEIFDKLKSDSQYIHTDLYTDLLFNPACSLLSRKVFKYSRFYCDVERLPDDELESSGNGFYYTNIPVTGESIRTVSNQKEYSKVKTLYEQWNASLKDTLLEQLRNLKHVYVIDCHSFSAFQVGVPEDELPDICIGYNDNTSFQLIALTKTYFENSGLSVSLNYPYANSKTVVLDDVEHSHSIMIEVNKRTYMNDDYTLNSKFNIIKGSIDSYLSILNKKESNRNNRVL